MNLGSRPSKQVDHKKITRRSSKSTISTMNEIFNRDDEKSFGIKIIRILNTEIYQNLDGVLEMVGREVVMRREATGS
jgi:very-short-patch-repair endonuclease